MTQDNVDRLAFWVPIGVGIVIVFPLFTAMVACEFCISPARAATIVGSIFGAALTFLALVMEGFIDIGITPPKR